MTTQARPDRALARRVLSRTAGVMLSLAVGLLLGELGAGAVRGFAFPYLNLFTPDSAYGVRLQPKASTRTRSRTGRVTRVRTNGEGFRGREWREAEDLQRGRVLLLGDSQMFGYGVEEEQAVAARLSALLDADVLCAAVPTWGPFEYARVAAELVPRFRPEHVVIVANVANDWFEARVSNMRRTTARDGWASRVRATGSGAPTSFFGRDLLMQRSQLVFLVRELGVVLREGTLPPNQSADLLAGDVTKLRRGPGGYSSPLAPHLALVKETCARHRCGVLAVALPLDVMVHEGEWAKYGSPPLELGPAEGLLDDLLADANALGLPSLSALPALREASPGAFLDDDYHLSPRGHDVMARVLASALGGAEKEAP